ncbi:MAG: YidC/Oxa1 family rane protein insertase [Pseudonocardiales bacterium]|nr:YidC/Oxa1 family rane protein insertase [Pseudonocardiales bacterium]MDT4929100.1 YidC/Oxa1 family rane protein insertase [Pseudonocardiales bacterium]
MLNFLYVAVSWVLLRWHQLLVAIGLNPDSGLTWALSIVLLVITARLLLFRMFVKQVHYQRNMQKMQPKIKKLREKYKDDRAELNRQMMKFQQEEGFNPIAGCLPMFLQIPVFLGLYHVLRHLSNSVTLCEANSNSHLLTLYTFSRTETCSGARANLFGAPLAASFRDSTAKVIQLGGDVTSTRWVILPLLLISAAATLVTQLMVRANATVEPEGTAATIQRVMLYIIPVGVLASGLLFNFPLGVLLYWFTSNLWTLAQQAYIIRYHPPTDEPEKPVGELGKTLAPRPGQRPVRMAKGKVAPADDDAPEEPTANATKAETPPAARSAVPRPGQRPNRPNGKRPPAKRPTQSKKRR